MLTSIGLTADTQTQEQWRPVVGYEGRYEVSDRGRVKSFYSGNGKKPGAILVPSANSTGRLILTLCKNAKHANAHVHSLVLEAFVGPCPDGMECCHSDGNPLNNRVVNLRWDTRKANADDRDKHGRTYRGEQNARSKLTKAQVLEIRAIRNQPRSRSRPTYEQLGKKYGVHLSTIAYAVGGDNWQWLR